MDERASIPRKGPTSWGFALAVFIVIGLGTTVIAILSHKQQSDSDHVRFNEEARLVDQALSDEINDAFVGIAQISHYLGQTLATSSPEQFDQFIEGSGFEENYPILRNGLLVVELIDDADLPTFVARERQFDPGFEVRPMVEGYDSPTSWVVTRATNADSFGVNLRGADI